MTTPLTSASTSPLNQPHGYAAEPTGSHTPTLPPQLPATAGRSVSEYAVLAALQAIVANTNYDGFMSTIRRQWPGLQEYIRPSRSTWNQPSASHTGRGCSPPTPSSSRGEGQNRKRNERSTLASPHIPSASGTLKSPTSNPPPDEK